MKSGERGGDRSSNGVFSDRLKEIAREKATHAGDFAKRAERLKAELPKAQKRTRDAMGEIPGATRATEALEEHRTLPGFEQDILVSFLNGYGISDGNVPISLIEEFTQRYGEHQQSVLGSILTQCGLPLNADRHSQLDYYLVIGYLGRELQPPSCGCAGDEQPVTPMRQAGEAYVCEGCGNCTGTQYPAIPGNNVKTMGGLGLKSAAHTNDGRSLR